MIESALPPDFEGGPELGDFQSSEAASQYSHEPVELWVAFVRAVFGGTRSPEDLRSPDLSELAEAINLHPEDAGFDGLIASHFLVMTSALKATHGTSGDTVRQQLSELVTLLSATTLRRLLMMGGTLSLRRQLVVDATEALELDAVLGVALAAAAVSSRGFSRPVVRLLFKFATQAKLGSPSLRPKADRALREQIQRLMDRWWLSASEPLLFGYEEMFQTTPTLSNEGDQLTPEADRMVRMSLEIDTVGASIWGPIDQMLEVGHIGKLLDLIRQAPPDSKVAATISQQLATPARLSSMLKEDRIDWELVDRLLDQMGTVGSRALMDELIESQSTATRRAVFDRLVRFGRDIGPLAVERLADERWFVLRNLLALLSAVDYWPERSAPDRYIAHSDLRVRKEALRLFLRLEEHRDRAILAALKEPDIQVVRLAFHAARDGVPDAAVPLIIRRIENPEFPADVRVLGIRILQGTRSRIAHELLLRVASGTKSIIGTIRLAEKSPELLAALTSLAATWEKDPRTAELLERARKSRDPEVRNAAQPPRGTAVGGVDGF